MEAGANVNMTDEAGRTVLMAAAEAFDDAEFIILLPRRGADPDAKTNNYNYTALMAAATFGHTATLKTLLSAGALVNAQHKDGTEFTPELLNSGLVP